MQDEPPLRHDLHPCTNDGHELTEEKEPVIAIPQGGKCPYPVRLVCRHASLDTRYVGYPILRFIRYRFDMA